MKQILLLSALSLGILFATTPQAAAGPSKADMDKRLSKLTAKFETLQAKPEKRVPADTLRKAQGIVLVDRTKAGFIFAYQGGGGVAFVRDPKTKKWGPPSFVSTSEASLGFQIGGQQSFVVFLLMNTNSIRMLTDSNFEFGGEASGTAGNSSAVAEGTVSSTEPAIITYTDKEGLYGGAAVKGGALSPDTEGNAVYYDKYLSVPEIIYDKKLKTTEAAEELLKRIEKYSK
jgi:lipid-binding SYLF domain-containing protein